MSTLTVRELVLSAAAIGETSPLAPLAADADVHGLIRAAPDVPPEDARYVGYGSVASPLPYLMQDGYTRERSPRAFRAAVLESDRLRAIFLPEVGGRLWSLQDLKSGRELLFRNPVFQPANLAIRNAWFAGGVEWNVGLVGHCPFTCSPLFAAAAEGPGGVPLLRLYEWERIRGVCFQIDAWLPDGSPLLFVHVRITNPNGTDVPMYWWSNTAVPESAHTRVIAPADGAYTFAYGGEMRSVPMPVWEGIDRSYPSRGARAADYFFRVPEKVRPWIAAVDGEGVGLFQTSTSLLRGRKLFLWGMGAGGRRWQGFLSEPGMSYLEIQAGLARTQAEHLPMPPRSEWCWVEAYGRIDVPADEAHSPDWAHAKAAVERAIEALAPASLLEREHARFAPSLTAPPSRVFQNGSGWGALEARRRRKVGLPDPHPAGVLFDQASIGPEQEGWAALLETGRMSARDPESAVRGLLVGRAWRELLEASVAGGGGGWLGWYHLGVMRAHDGELEAALAAFEESLRRRRTAWALRNLALLQRFRGERERSISLYLEALRERPDSRQLAVECAEALIGGGRSAEWLGLAATLHEAVRESGRVRLETGKAWLELGELEELRAFLDDPPEIPDMREGEVSLSDLWFGMHERARALETGKPLDEAARARVRRDHPPPAAIDFRMSSDS